jgi:outer membrane immunogenic protein
MKSLLLAASVLVLTAGAAEAQGTGYNWSGVYLGLQGGFGGASSTIIGTEGGYYKRKLDPSGGFGGAHLGWQWQTGMFVYGAEAEINASSMEESSDSSSQPGNFFKTDIKWFGAANAKFGVAMDRVLLYGTAGVSAANIETGQNASTGDEFSSGKTYVGWTAGAGMDFAVTNNLIAGLRYRYYDFGKQSYDVPAPFLDRDQDVKLHTIAVGVSYKF